MLSFAAHESSHLFSFINGKNTARTRTNKNKNNEDRTLNRAGNQT